MINVKKIIGAVTVALILITPVTARADIGASTTLDCVEEGINRINLSLKKANSIIKSFQITINTNGAKVKSIDWSNKIKENAVANFKEVSENEVTIYVTSTVDLVDENGNLDIGYINVTGDKGNMYTVTATNLKAVSLNNKKAELASVSTEDVKFVLGETIDDSNTGGNNPSLPEEDDSISKPEEDDSITGGDNTSKPEEDDSITGGDNISKPEEDDSIAGGDNISKPEEDGAISGGDNSSDSEGNGIIIEGDTNTSQEEVNTSEESNSVADKIKDVVTGDNNYIYAIILSAMLAFGGIIAFARKKNIYKK